MEENWQIRKLQLWNRFWVCLLVIATLTWAGKHFIDAQTRDLYTLHDTWDGQGLKLSAMSDGPFVVTHLVDRYSKTWAALPRPVAVVNSHGAYIPVEEMQKLYWQDYLDQPCPFPLKNADIKALYYLPLTTNRIGER